MFSNKKLLATICFAVLLTLLFYKQGIGINLVIAELALLFYFFATRQIHMKGFLNISLTISLLTSLSFTIITHSTFIYIMHFLVLLAFVGSLIYAESKSVLTNFGLAISNVFTAQFNLVEAFASSKIRGKNLGKILWKLKIYIFPVIILFVFVLLYRNSNPIFNKIYLSIRKFVFDQISHIVDYIELYALFTFILALLISAFLILRAQQEDVVKDDLNASDVLKRTRKKNSEKVKTMSLKYEYKAAVFLIFSLNALLLFLNILDIQYVWFDFTWEGQFLKEFVHQGTYLLIVSILISIGLVLYFFRSNLNFFSANKLLKVLSYIWLAQNAVLIISVVIRNYYYIQYFALAYKRIGVFIFLTLALIGLFTVFLKVRNGKSYFFLWRINALAALYVLTFSACLNWDVIIAKYNYNNAHKSFLHLEYLARLSDKALPYLDFPIEDLQKVEEIQSFKFSFKRHYITPIEYKFSIQERKVNFIRSWETKRWLSWNLAEYRAYQALTDEKKN